MSMPAGTVPIYVINLDRAANRWQRLRDQAERFGLVVRRIAAVDGRTIAEHERVDFQAEQFNYHNGRRLLPGEYGCYRSHLAALAQIAEGDEDVAIIAEDDIDLNLRLIPRALAALRAVPGAGVVKLVNHRIVGFRPVAVSAEKDVVGRCLHGPQGSAACYIVTRGAARKLVVTMRQMLLPFDVALERGWATGVETFTTEADLIDFSPLRSETAIGKPMDYRSAKKHFLLRPGVHWFRSCDQIRRWIYTLQARTRRR